jgi:hypothetical protein
MNSDDLARWLTPSEHLPIDDDGVRPRASIWEATTSRTKAEAIAELIDPPKEEPR